MGLSGMCVLGVDGAGGEVVVAVVVDGDDWAGWRR